MKKDCLTIENDNNNHRHSNIIILENFPQIVIISKNLFEKKLINRNLKTKKTENYYLTNN